MYVKTSNESCSGCGLCAHMCKNGAITMKYDDDGFSYPEIDKEKCNDCGLCRKICPFSAENHAGTKTVASFALKHTDEVRRASSSGGFFTLLSDYVLSLGGVIYGAVWTDSFSVRHIRAEDASTRNKMRSSKYIQSDITAILPALRADVDAGREVLFTGTPCQCAAVFKLFGGKSPENLTVMDVICHGVLPQKFFDEYIKDIEKKHPGRIIKTINLRDKRFGLQTVGIEFDDGFVYSSEGDYFYKTYAMHSLQRPSCFACTCANESRFSDFTVGDFWGCRENMPEFYDELGISVVLANNEKAKTLYETLAADRSSIDIPKEKYFAYQPNLSRPTAKGKRAEEFYSHYKRHGYKKTMHRFFDVTLMRRINKLGSKLLKKLLPR